jgi:hypothetical protein
MDNDILRVPKQLKPVTLWVHPEGRVLGALFLREQSPYHAGPEQPLEVLNQSEPFLVFRRDEPKELRFYNKRAIIRVEYPAAETPAADATAIQCRLHMMDGSLISGLIHEPLPPHQARLLDYLNKTEDSFIKIHMDEGLVYLVNKAYIIHVHVANLDDEAMEE